MPENTPTLQQILTEHPQMDDGLTLGCRCGVVCPAACTRVGLYDAWWAAHVDEVWRNSRTITEPSVIDTLPDRSRVESHGQVYTCRAGTILGRVWNDDRAGSVYCPPLPATVLYIPTAPEEESRD